MVTNNVATGYSNQRKLDRCQNGNLVSFFSDTGTNGTFRVSTDNGVTWTNPAIDIAGVVNGSMFIDLDDYLHVVWKQSGTGGGRTDGYIYYMRGTPNAGRTSWTWSAAQVVSSNGSGYHNYPDVVAHREGTGWVAHTIQSFNNTTTNTADYMAFDITSGGAISVRTALMNASGAYAANVHTFPSIDFNHTGDGKTVAGGTPHLYAAWSAGKTGAGFGIRFRKATYSAGTWTWNTEVEIDNTQYVFDTARWLNCLFDGIRVIITGFISNLNNASYNIYLYERDAADTTTTARGTIASGLTGSYLINGSATYDAAGNIYYIGRSNSIAGFWGYTFLFKWTRSTLTMGAAVNTDQVMENAPTSGMTVSLKRGYSNGRIEWVYTSGNNSPYAVKYDYLPTSIIGLFIKKVKTVTDLYRDKMRARGYNI